MSKEVEGRMEMLSYQIQRDYQLWEIVFIKKKKF
jgi:hypothetical protein